MPLAVSGVLGFLANAGEPRIFYALCNGILIDLVDKPEISLRIERPEDYTREALLVLAVLMKIE